MNFASLRIITGDVGRLVAFYERVSGHAARWSTPDFAEVGFPSCTLAIGSTRTVGLFGAGSAEAGVNRSVIVEFIVDDVDARYADLSEWLEEVVTPPTTMPWGNRALLFRDPDGNLVNIFTPVTEEAVAKFVAVSR